VGCLLARGFRRRNNLNMGVLREDQPTGRVAAKRLD